MQLRLAADVASVVAVAERPADRGFSIVYLSANGSHDQLVRETRDGMEPHGYLVRDATRPSTRPERRACWQRHVVVISTADGEPEHVVPWIRELGEASGRSHLLVISRRAAGGWAPDLRRRPEWPTTLHESPPAYDGVRRWPAPRQVRRRAVRRAATFARARRPAAVCRWLRAGVAEALRHGHERDAVDAAQELAGHHRSRGDWPAASRVLDQVFRRVARWPVRCEAGLLAVAAAIDCGDLDEAERRVSLVAAETTARAEPLLSAVRCLWTEIRLRQDRCEEAVAAIDGSTGTDDELRVWRALIAWRLGEPNRWPEVGEGVGPAADAARIFLDAAGARGRRTPDRRRPPTTQWLSMQRDYVRLALQRAARDVCLDRRLPPVLVSSPVPAPCGTQSKGESRMHLIEALPTLLERLASAEDDQAAVSGACRWARSKPGVAGAAVMGTSGALVVADGISRADIALPAIRDVVVRGQARMVSTCGRAFDVQPVRHGGAVIGSAVLVGDERTVETLREAATAVAAVIGPALRAELDRKSVLRARHTSLPEIVGRSPAMAEVRDAIARVASTTFPVLIEGESGTGKELVARAVHRLSPRRDRAFCPVNCAALTDDLLEAELFGHVRGAFTGAVGARAGLFEEAHGGTLLMDEVAELSPRGQAKVLRALQEGEVRRLGENTARRVDARVVAATNRPLAEAAARGTFREDLLFRLAVARVRMPPLRDRIEDIPVLATTFWRLAALETGTKAVLGPEALSRLCRHTWPGNVRELQNTMAALTLIAPRRGRVSPGLVSQVVGASADSAASGMGAVSLLEARRQCERRCIAEALIRNGGRRSAAARELGLTRQGLSKAVRRVGLHVPKRTEGVA